MSGSNIKKNGGVSRWSVSKAFPPKCLSKLRVLGRRQKKNASNVTKLGREVV